MKKRTATATAITMIPPSPIVSSQTVISRALSRSTIMVRMVTLESATRVPTKRAKVKMKESRGDSVNGAIGWGAVPWVCGAWGEELITVCCEHWQINGRERAGKEVGKVGGEEARRLRTTSPMPLEDVGAGAGRS